MKPSVQIWLTIVWLTFSSFVTADDPPADAVPATEQTVEQLAAEAKKSVVVVTFRGRDGEKQGLGTGFVFDPDGLIATNLHVIGEARPISVRLADGKEYDVTAIHATEKSQDLAILKIDAQNLPALRLGNSDQLQEGQSVVAIGNPLGLEHSVVAGVLSGRRDIDGRAMLQVAIPIEKGNSGGPLLDRQGRVHGLLTMKSLKTENLGFAVPVNALKPLIEKPNPISISRWLTIGVLDADDWTVLPGSRWRQRAGKILVDGRGAGIGGRAICLSTIDVPEAPYEIAVKVKYGPEDGAAGLVFHADGGDKHYGFYPSNGELRLSRFDGADVYAWQVLHQIRSPHLKSDGWNTLKVRIEPERFVCYVNGEQVFESKDGTYKSGKAGLCKFRHTEAEFQSFQVGKELTLASSQDVLSDDIRQLLMTLPLDKAAPDDLLDRLSGDESVQRSGLDAEAKRLELQAKRLRDLAGDIHRARTLAEFRQAVEDDDDQIDLMRAALLIAKLDNAEVDVDAYLRDVDKLAKRIEAKFAADADEMEKLATLHRVLFEELGYHGSRTDYYNASNSYLNEVLDDREGLPITLAVLYMELGRRLGLKIEGVGLPGHFVARFVPKAGESQIVDVFEQGEKMSVEQAKEKVLTLRGGEWDDEFLAAQPPKAILNRMLRNLFGVARESRKAEDMYRYVECVLILDPESPSDRFLRAVLAYQTDRLPLAQRDVQWLLDRHPEGAELRTIEDLAAAIARAQAGK